MSTIYQSKLSAIYLNSTTKETVCYFMLLFRRPDSRNSVKGSPPNFPSNIKGIEGK